MPPPRMRWALPVLLLALAAAVCYAVVGPTPGGDGTYALSSPRVDKTGAAVVQQSGGAYGEASVRGLTYCASDQGSGVAPGTALGTTAALVLYNPAGNSFRFRVQKVRVGYISGTLGAGTLFHCALKTTTQTAPSGGTALTALCLDVGNGSVGTGLARTGATVVQPVIIGAFGSLQASLATTAADPWQLTEDIKAEIVLEPGCTYQLQAVAAAGTSPLISPSVTWTEEPLK